MGYPAPSARMSYAEYLAAEERSDVRHEFLNGEVWEMAGGTPEHAALAAAMIAELSSRLRGKPCRIYSSDLRIRIQETGLATYPDVAVVCGQLATAVDDEHAALNPVVLVEVLSPTTEGYDRGAKAAHYRRIPALREYVLVSQSEPPIEVHRRTESGRWELFDARPGETIELASLGVRLDVSAIYANPLAAG